MILREQTVHVHSAGADIDDGAAVGVLADCDVEALGCGLGHDGAAESIKGACLNAAGKVCEPLIPVRVHLDSALLHDYAQKIIPGVEGKAAAVEAHNVILSILIEDSELEANGQILAHPDLQVGLAQRCK